MTTVSRTAALAAARAAARDRAKAAAAARAASAAAARGNTLAPAQPTSGGLVLPIIGEVTPAKVVVGGALFLGGVFFLTRKKK
jgi:hypothetical protein